MKISAFIVCFNEENHIRRCLESVKWCDEVIVIDSGSQDKTIEICQEFTDRIINRSWNGYVSQKQFGLSQCTGDWVLNIDADEEVSTDLKNEIISTLNSHNLSDDINGYYLSRVIYFLGKWWRRGSWYPEYRLRLVKKSVANWGGDDPHEKAIVPGKTKKLCGELYHYTYADIKDQVARLNQHSSSAAFTMHSKGEHTNIIKILFNPIIRFIKSYILKGGFKEGFPGLVVAVMEAYYVFLKYIKLWELQRINKS